MADVVKRARAQLDHRAPMSQVRRFVIQSAIELDHTIEDPIIFPSGLVADLCDTIDKLRAERRRLRKRVAVLRGMLPTEDDWRPGDG